MRPGPSRGLACGLLLLGALAGMTASAAPREIPIPTTVAPAPPATGISDYPAALQAIVNVLAGPLRLAMPAYTLEVHTEPQEFQQALVRHLKLEAQAAAMAMRLAKAAVGDRRILLNGRSMLLDDWPARLQVLAHELVHPAQLELAGHRPLRKMWLVEGFAEWTAHRVVHAIGARPLSASRQEVLARVRTARSAGRLPALAQLELVREWVQARQDGGDDALYLSVLAVDLLVQRHSYDALLDYFHRLRGAADSDTHFEAAFGETQARFQQALEAHLDEVLR